MFELGQETALSKMKTVKNVGSSFSPKGVSMENIRVHGACPRGGNCIV